MGPTSDPLTPERLARIRRDHAVGLAVLAGDVAALIDAADEAERLREEAARYRQLAADADAAKGGLTVRVEWANGTVTISGPNDATEADVGRGIGETLLNLNEVGTALEAEQLRGAVAELVALLAEVVATAGNRTLRDRDGLMVSTTDDLRDRMRAALAKHKETSGG